LSDDDSFYGVFEKKLDVWFRLFVVKDMKKIRDRQHFYPHFSHEITTHCRLRQRRNTFYGKKSGPQNKKIGFFLGRAAGFV